MREVIRREEVDRLIEDVAEGAGSKGKGEVIHALVEVGSKGEFSEGERKGEGKFVEVVGEYQVFSGNEGLRIWTSQSR